MWRVVLLAIAAFYTALAVTMWVMPQTWYALTPGVSMMGPFNSHFVRDAALAYFVAGTAMGWGTWKGEKIAVLLGAYWPALHGLFHIWIWFGRGVPLDFIALVNLVGIQLPAWAALWAAHRHFARRTAA